MPCIARTSAPFLTVPPWLAEADVVTRDFQGVVPVSQ